MIPKIIHLCWFSLNLPPKRVRKCIRSWKRIMPEYKIMLWTKRRALASGIPFVKEAIGQKKWAFAADAIRLYAVHKYGGLYLDSDILLYKNLEELFTHRNVFFSEYYPDRVEYEKTHSELGADDRWGCEIQAACFAAEKGSKVIASILEHYTSTHFLKSDGSLAISPIAPQIFARSLERFAYRYVDEEQMLENDTIVYPSALLLCNRSFSSDVAFGMHICTQSWK